MAVIPALMGIGSAIGGALSTAGPLIGGLSGLFMNVLGQQKAKISPPSTTPLPGAPSPEDAMAKAKADAANRRKMSILSGGTTNKTGALGAPVGQENVLKKTLGGA